MQSLPPCAAGIETFRRRSVMPPPHDFVQSFQSLQSSQAHSTGQGVCPHMVRRWSSPSQGLPPARASTARWRPLLAQSDTLAPQVTLHAVQWVQSAHWQFTAHSLTKQSFSSESKSLQARPPPSSLEMIFRSRALVPFPQFAEQADHRLQSDITQSLGHAFTLHTSSSCEAPSHLRPPATGTCATDRLRSFTPPAQLVEQAPQALQSVHPQSRLHG
mmetsp:Transcript_29791/g.70890  ORF Transcript_29791/g.70890 Transcript_29791/m.70890 type:complete len:216 (-) Transcript_29791:752-1399(-)